jgi:hypothetical protein
MLAASSSILVYAFLMLLLTEMFFTGICLTGKEAGRRSPARNRETVFFSIPICFVTALAALETIALIRFPPLRPVPFGYEKSRPADGFGSDTVSLVRRFRFVSGSPPVSLAMKVRFYGIPAFFVNQAVVIILNVKNCTLRAETLGEKFPGFTEIVSGHVIIVLGKLRIGLGQER